MSEVGTTNPDAIPNQTLMALRMECLRLALSVYSRELSVEAAKEGEDLNSPIDVADEMFNYVLNGTKE